MKLTTLLFINLNALLVVAAGWDYLAQYEILARQVYNNVVIGEYDEAVAQTIQLQNNGQGPLISDVVKQLVGGGKRNTVEYAYKLWKNQGQEIVKLYFPLEFRLIFNRHHVKLINNRDSYAVKLGWNTDSQGDRLAYGDSNKSTDRVIWEFYPYMYNNRVYFEIVNIKHNQYLKVASDSDIVGEHRGWASDNSDTQRHQWYLQPVAYGNYLLFLIYNRQYNHALKLSRIMDFDGDRLVWSHNGDAEAEPEKFGWFIEAA